MTMSVGLEIIGYVNTVLNFLSSLFKKFKRKPVASSGPFKSVFTSYEDIKFANWNDLKWLLRFAQPIVPHEHDDYLWLLKQGKPISNPTDALKRVRIEGPYCPKCETELSKHTSFFIFKVFGKTYKYECSNCHFKKRLKKPDELIDSAYKIFEAKFRKAFETGNIKEL
jgi:hypothetical protein